MRFRLHAMTKKATGKPDAEPDMIDKAPEARGLTNPDCEICGERLGARQVWRSGVYYGYLCPDCERDGRRGVARSRPAD